MPLKTDQTEEPALNLTPMVDVLFLLLVFFLVGTRFTEAEREFEVDLPTAAVDAAPLTGEPDELVINVSADGAFFLGEEAVTPEELAAKLAEAKAGYAGQGVVIRGDGQGAYQYVVDALAAAKGAGITEISLANRPPGTGGE